MGVVFRAQVGALAAGAALLVAFVFVERRAAEPVLPLWVFSRRLLCRPPSSRSVSAPS